MEYTHKQVFTNSLLLSDSPSQRAFIKHLFLGQVNILVKTKGE